MTAAEEDLIEEQVDSKDHPLEGEVGGQGQSFLFYYYSWQELQIFFIIITDDFDDDLDDLEIDIIDLGSSSCVFYLI